MRRHATPSSRTNPAFHLQHADPLGGMSVETPVERGRPAPARPIAIRPCDGCGDADPAVDLWAEHHETGEQLWLCLACGD